MEVEPALCTVKASLAGLPRQVLSGGPCSLRSRVFILIPALGVAPLQAGLSRVCLWEADTVPAPAEAAFYVSRRKGASGLGGKERVLFVGEDPLGLRSLLV